MPIARVENGQVVEQRQLDITDVPEHKRELWKPVVIEGSGEITNTVIEADRVRLVRSPRPITSDDVAAERNRRLALGFDYAFGDTRGTHHIGTTEADMKGWDEVSKYAGALIDIGDTTTTINIATNTGLCAVTAPEWRVIEIASAEFRQPLWVKSFALMASNPIPADYTNDQYWT